MLLVCEVSYPIHVVLHVAKSALSIRWSGSVSVEHAAFVSGDHILNVDERVFSTVYFKQFKSLLNEIP